MMKYIPHKHFMDLPIVELTERNLRALLEKLSDPQSERTLLDPDRQIKVKAVPDEAHYGDRPPGPNASPGLNSLEVKIRKRLAFTFNIGEDDREAFMHATAGMVMAWEDLTGKQFEYKKEERYLTLVPSGDYEADAAEVNPLVDDQNAEEELSQAFRERAEQALREREQGE